MNVTHVITTLDKSAGGPSRSLPSMCLGLKKEGVVCNILTYKSTNPNIDFTDGFIKSLNMIDKEQTLFGRFCSKNIIRLIKDDIDILHLHNLWSPLLHNVSVFAKRKGLPVVWSPRGTLEPWPLKQKCLKKKLALLFYQRKDLSNAICIHATALEEANNIRKLGFKNHIAVIPNAIDINSYPKKKWSSESKKTISFLSRLHPKKGIEIFLEAWNRLPLDLTRDWRIKIAGEGSGDYSVDYLRNLVKTHYYNFNIEFVGPKYGEDKLYFLHQSDLFILPTYSENFGMAIAEAMACGVPVITTTGTPWSVLNDKNAGWCVNPDVNSLVSSLLTALALDRSTLAKKGLICRNIIEDNFSTEIVSRQYLYLYEWLLNQNLPKPNFVL